MLIVQYAKKSAKLVYDLFPITLLHIETFSFHYKHGFHVIRQIKVELRRIKFGLHISSTAIGGGKQRTSFQELVPSSKTRILTIKSRGKPYTDKNEILYQVF